MLQPSALSRYSTPVRRELRDGVVFIAGVPPASSPRLICAFGAMPPLVWVMAEARSFYGDDAGYELCIDADLRQAEEPLLLARGFAITEEEPGLVLPTLPAPNAIVPPSDLDIRLVQDEAEFESFFSISRTPRHIVPSLAAATDPAVGLLIGRAGGQPVGTARFTLHQSGVVDIMGVVTVESHRRRGIGTAMTWAAVAEATRRGATAATLTATEMGYPVYLKMGFLRACTFRTYDKGGS